MVWWVVQMDEEDDSAARVASLIFVVEVSEHCRFSPNPLHKRYVVINATRGHRANIPSPKITISCLAHFFSLCSRATEPPNKGL